MKSFKIKIVACLIVSMLCSSCALFPTQRMIDSILPEYDKRMYTVADLIPYDYKEVKNAQALYGNQLSEFFYSETATKAELERDTKEKQEAFYKELRIRNHNYKTLKKRYSMYVADENESEESKVKERQAEYDAYYKIGNAKGAATIKKYNNGKLDGMPVFSLKAIMSTATESETSSIYTECDCEIYTPTIIKDDDYRKLKFGDTIELVFPATNSTVNCKKTVKKKCTYVATDSLLYINENNGKEYYFIADQDGTNTCRRIVNYFGDPVETYTETKTLEFMKLCRVAEANEPQRLMSEVAQDSLEEYDFSKLVERAMCGGYLVYRYKDYVYANSVTTNLKGYITSMIYYDNLRIDNEYYEELNK